MKLGSTFVALDSRAGRHEACGRPCEGCGSVRVFTRDGVGGLAGGAVRVGQLEPALVLGAGLQIQDAAGEAVGNGVVEILAAAVDVLAADADQRQRVAPGWFRRPRGTGR